MNDDREGILVHWPAESPIWFSGSSLCHVECEWHSSLRDLETNHTGCSTTSVQGFKTFRTYQNRTFSNGYNVSFVCGMSHIQINIRPGTCYSEFSRYTPFLQAYAGTVPQIRTTAIFHFYFQTSIGNIWLIPVIRRCFFGVTEIVVKRTAGRKKLRTVGVWVHYLMVSLRDSGWNNHVWSMMKQTQVLLLLRDLVWLVL